VPQKALILVGVLCGLCVLALLFSTEVREAYFSPDEFRYRVLVYREIPYVGVQVWPSRVEEYPEPFLDYLHENGYVPPPRAGAARWHFVSGSRRGIRGWKGGAYEVFRAIKRLRRVQWLKWTRAHPKHARELWTLFARIVHEERYRTALLVIEETSWAPGPLHLPIEEYDEHLAEALARAAARCREPISPEHIRELLRPLENGGEEGDAGLPEAAQDKP